ncbi:MAG: hypothetical protein QXN97_02250 [Desulfurococcaceae archaeon]
MKEKTLIYSGVLEVIEYPGVIFKESILVKPLYVYIGDIEKEIVTGHLPINKPIKLGSMGVVRVVEVQGSNTEYSGQTYSVSPFGSKGLLGISEDGILANFSSIHPSYLDEPLLEVTPMDALRPLIKHGFELAKNSVEPVLIEGCGLIGLITGLSLRSLGMEPLFYCEEGSRVASSYGFTCTSHLGNISKKWGSIILTSSNMASKHRILVNLDYSRLVLSRLSHTTWIPLKNDFSSVQIVLVGKGGNLDQRIYRQIMNDIGKRIKVYEAVDLNDALGLFPPRGLGFILSIK